MDELELVSCSDIGHYIAQNLKFHEASSLFRKFIQDYSYNKLDAPHWGIKYFTSIYQDDSYYEDEIKELNTLIFKAEKLKFEQTNK